MPAWRLRMMQMPELVHVDDQDAEEAFSHGRLLFDVTAEARGLGAFFEAPPHLRGAMERTADGRYGHVSSVLSGDRLLRRTRPVFCARPMPQATPQAKRSADILVQAGLVKRIQQPFFADGAGMIGRDHAMAIDDYIARV
jgi:hypothetical protein